MRLLTETLWNWFSKVEEKKNEEKKLEKTTKYFVFRQFSLFFWETQTNKQKKEKINRKPNKRQFH